MNSFHFSAKARAETRKSRDVRVPSHDRASINRLNDYNFVAKSGFLSILIAIVNAGLMGILWFWVTVLKQFDRVWNFSQIRPQYDTNDMPSCCLEGIKDMSSVYKGVGRCRLLTKYATCRSCVKGSY